MDQAGLGFVDLSASAFLSSFNVCLFLVQILVGLFVCFAYLHPLRLGCTRYLLPHKILKCNPRILVQYTALGEIFSLPIGSARCSVIRLGLKRFGGRSETQLKNKQTTHIVLLAKLSGLLCTRDCYLIQFYTALDMF